MALVYLDAGHGGYDNGATYEGRLEKDDNLALALAVGEILEDNGVDVGYTRTEDVYDSPVRKAQIANEAGADLFVSIHRNSSPYPETYSGVQSLIFDSGGLKEDVAKAINSELEEVGFNNLGIELRRNLAVLRRTNMDAVLVEAGFINTDADNQLFDSEFNNVAYAIANGIYKTLNGRDIPRENYDFIVPPQESGQTGNYIVQTGLFRNYNNAQTQYNSLTALGIPANIGQYNDYYRVSAGERLTYLQAVNLENRLKAAGYDTLIVKL